MISKFKQDFYLQFNEVKAILSRNSSEKCSNVIHFSDTGECKNHGWLVGVSIGGMMQHLPKDHKY